MPDRWESFPIVCRGGLDLETNSLVLGQANPGAALILTNYEASHQGGYRRINGYIKYDNAVVTGDDNEPVLGVKVGLGGVFAARYTTTGTDNAVYFSSGSGWTQINTTPRTGDVEKYRFISYSITEPVLIMCDGVNPAGKWDGSTYSLINGTGAPADPKYAELHLARLVLSGYDEGSTIAVSVANTDTDFDGGNGALEFNVGDTVMGLKRFRETLYIFCLNSIWKLVGSTSDDFEVQSVTRSLGCIASDSIQELGGDIVFLAADGFRSLAATERIGDIELGLVSHAITLLLAESIIGIAPNNTISSCIIRNKSQFRLFYYEDGVEQASALGFIGRLNDNINTEKGQFSWSTTRGIKAFCSDSEYQNDDELAVIGDGSNGYVYQLEAGNDFDGVAIDSVYATPFINFNDPSIRKVLQKLRLYTQVEGSINLFLDTVLDGEETEIIQPPTLSISLDGNISTYGTAVYDTDNYSILEFNLFKTNLIGSGFTAQFVFYSTSSDPPHRIDSLHLTYSIKGRR
jgi:hypothetical protein